MDRWLFLHVMKTAGTSFRAMLEEGLGAAVYPSDAEVRAQPHGWYYDADTLFRLIDGGRLDLGSRQMVCGHYAARLVEVLPAHLPGRWRTVTFLRDPVARTLSMISHSAKYRPGIPGLRRFRKVNIGRALADPGFIESQVRNYQAKVFAMDPTGDVNAPFAVDAASFRRARAALEAADVVGLTERLEPSIRLFEATSGIAVAESVPQRNVSRGYNATDEELERVRALVPWDIELYELAREKLERDLRAAFGDRFAAAEGRAADRPDRPDPPASAAGAAPSAPGA
jgi:hypothetical protein